MAYDLLDFQHVAVAKLKALFASASRILLQSATGSGKTVIAGKFVSDYLAEDPNHKVLCLVALQALVTQFHETVENFGVKVSVLHDEITRAKDGTKFPVSTSAGFYDNRFLLTMPETFLNTVGQIGKNKLFYDVDWMPTLILIDEAHKGTSKFFQLIRDMFPDAKVLGLTATPYRDKNEEGEHLTEWYGDNLVTTISVRELIDMGRLVQPFYFSKDSDAHVVATWLELTLGDPNKGTIVFTRDTRHSFALKDAFVANGVSAEVITAGTDADPTFVVNPQTPNQRQAIYSAFDRGEVDVLISVNALCEGFDSPRAKYCFLNRGIGNHALYQQMIGRVLRAFKDKLNAIVVDFHDNIKAHGHIEDYQWTLSAEVPDNLFIRNKGEMAEINYDTFTRKSGVFYRCESCDHVFDIKKSARCTHCRTVAKVSVKDRVDNLALRELGVILDKNLMEKIQAKYPAARRKDIVGKGTSYETCAQAMFKKHCKLDVFDATGDLRPEFGFMDALVGKKISDIIEVSVH